MLRPRSAQGFTLVELMLAALLGTFLSGVVFQLLFAETRQGGALAESLQLKQWQRRTLELLKGDLERASSLADRPRCFSRLALCLGRSSTQARHHAYETALILWCTAWVRRHRRSGAVMC